MEVCSVLNNTHLTSGRWKRWRQDQQILWVKTWRKGSIWQCTLLAFVLSAHCFPSVILLLWISFICLVLYIRSDIRKVILVNTVDDTECLARYLWLHLYPYLITTDLSKRKQIPWWFLTSVYFLYDESLHCFFFWNTFINHSVILEGVHTNVGKLYCIYLVNCFNKKNWKKYLHIQLAFKRKSTMRDTNFFIASCRRINFIWNTTKSPRGAYQQPSVEEMIIFLMQNKQTSVVFTALT